MSGIRLAQRLFSDEQVLRQVELIEGRAVGRPSGTFRLSLDTERATTGAKRQRTALLEAVVCYLKPEARNDCGMSSNMPAMKHDILQSVFQDDAGTRRWIYARDPSLIAETGPRHYQFRCDDVGAEKTRVRYYSLWRGFMTYATAQRRLQGVLSASKELVQAWATQLLMLGASPSLIRASLSAVQSRHNEYGLTPSFWLFQRTMQAVFSMQGAPRRVLTPSMMEADAVGPWDSSETWH